MATKKISELDAKTSLAGTEELLINDGGTSKKVTAANLVNTAITSADINGGTIDGATIGGSSAAAITGTTITGTSFVSSGDMTFGDNDKAIFGEGSDLQIYHDGSTSYINENGTGDLRILATDLRIINSAENTNLIRAFTSGAVELFYAGANKLYTTSTGIDVTGTVTADGLTVDGTGTSNFTSTATSPVQINGTTIPTLTIRNSTTPVETQIRATTTEGLVRTATNHPLVFATNAAERMRIDSSGNLLVGTTTAITQSGTTTGSRFSSTGIAWHIADNAPSLFLGRTSTDGTIIDFRKDGTTVGSIGNQGADTLYIDSANSTGTGLRFAGNQGIVPRYQGSDSDNVTNLGKSTNRFKDLYLSGGVYLGGTGAANYLDDYEEGYWTPIYVPQNNSFTAISYETQNGYYTKIGNVVNVRFFLRISSLTKGSASGYALIGGLPFAPSNSRSMGTVWSTNFLDDHPSLAQPITDGTLYLFYRDAADGSSNNILNVTDLDTSYADNYIICSLMYQTNS